jgi:hypothetical protein
LWFFRGGLRSKEHHHQKRRFLMNAPMEAKKPPEVKPGVRRVVAAAGVLMTTNAAGARRLGWWGVETAQRSAMAGSGRAMRLSGICLTPFPAMVFGIASFDEWFAGE